MMKQREEAETLHTLKVISEVLNQTNDIQSMCDTVLKELIQVTQLSTGWIFLVTDAKPDYTFVSSYQLPRVLADNQAQLMCSGSCWCLDTYWSGKLDKAVNIMECKRIEDAFKQGHHDCDGITHHATIPIIAGDETLGLLNVAAPNKTHFTKQELNLLQAVALQIGTGIKRARLYQKEQKRAQYYRFFGSIQARIEQLKQQGASFDELKKLFLEEALQELNWKVVYELILRADALDIQHVFTLPSERNQEAIHSPSHIEALLTELLKQRLVVNDSLNVTFQLKNGFTGRVLKSPCHSEGLFVVMYENPFLIDDLDKEIFQQIFNYLSLLRTSLQLKEQQFEIAKQEERHRLARDLHDSVCQMLFSLSLTTKGLEAGIKREEQLKEKAHYLETLADIQELATEAQREMRALIWQLRPFGLEQGLLSSLHSYAQKQGLQLMIEKEGVQNLPNRVEEHLWRIGQEAINNILKHAKTDVAYVSLKGRKNQLFFSIKDNGQGFQHQQFHPKNLGEQLGLQGIHERAELLGGSYKIISNAGQGTEIIIQVPFSEIKRMGE